MSVLQFEPGTHTTAPIDELKPHPFNDEIYTTQKLDDLVERIKSEGFKETGRLTIKPDGTILSGHRRWEAAKEIGLDTLPVEVVACDSEAEEKRRILIANEYREKTPGEKIREAEAWEELERKKAKDRQGERTDIEENLPESETGQSRDKAAEKVGVSGRTYDKGKEVKEKAEEGDETAQEEWGKLESGEQSIHGAYTNVKSEQTNGEETSKAREVAGGIKDRWQTAETADVEIQYRQGEEAGCVEIHVDGEDYDVPQELFNALFET